MKLKISIFFMNNRINIGYWLFPISYFLMVWLTMSEPTVGTDFAGQIYGLEYYRENPDVDFFESKRPMLYYYVYNALYSFTKISPRFYIAILSFIYFSIIFYICKKEANSSYYPYMNSPLLGKIALYACLCYSPLFICIARFHFATILTVIGLLVFHYNNKKTIRFIGISITLLAFWAHEGIMILYGIVILSWFLDFFWLSKVKNIRTRNIQICIIALMLFLVGTILFPLITSYLNSFGLLNEHYADSYAQQSAGDGAYLLVLILSLFGSILSLFVTSLFDTKSNWITAICVSGLFMMCLLFNQKFFYVQRIFMFMPVFMGLSCIQIMGSISPGRNKDTYVFLLLSVPAIYLCQLVIQRGLFFGN